MTIRTLNYGIVPVIKSYRYLTDKIIDTVEMDNGDYYDIRQSHRGVIVAILA